MHVFKDTLLIKMKTGYIESNTKYKRDSIYIKNVYLSLGKYGYKGDPNVWTTFNFGTKYTIDDIITKNNQRIDISKAQFKIPYNGSSDLKGSWVVMTLYHAPGTTYAHSTGKKQEYAK